MLPRIFLAALIGGVNLPHAAGQTPQELAKAVIDAAGGESKLLKVFRMKDSLVLGEDPKGKPRLRTGFVEAPLHWWEGKRDRVAQDKEPAVYLIWTWTLRPLLDPKTKVEVVAEEVIKERGCFGLKISESITPPMTVYFDKETKRLALIRWRGTGHYFSDHKQMDGVWYAAKCSGHYLTSGKAWYHTEIVEIERLKEVPAEAKGK
jgi:hypothetical protein